MKFFVLAALVAGAVAQSITINTPTNVVQCQPILLTWTGADGEVFLSLHDGNNPSSAALVDFGTPSGGSFSWVANFPEGTVLSLALRDSTGVTVQSAPFTIQPGTSDDCLTSSGSTGGSSTTSTAGETSTAGATTTGTTTATTPAGTSTAVSSTGGSSASTGTTSAGASETSGTDADADGALRLSAAGLIGGMLVPALVAIFA